MKPILILAAIAAASTAFGFYQTHQLHVSDNKAEYYKDIAEANENDRIAALEALTKHPEVADNESRYQPKHELLGPPPMIEGSHPTALDYAN